MLFNNFEPYNIPETGAISRETLKEIFPEFYAKEPTGIKVSAVASRFKTIKRVDEVHHIPVGIAKKSPPATGHKAIGNLTIDGKIVYLQYSQSMPQVEGFKKSFPLLTNRITLSDSMIVRPHEEDLLFFLYFGMGVFTNGHRSGRQALYEFVRPAERATREITDWKQSQALKTLVYSTLTPSQVMKAITGLQLPEKKNDNANKDLNRQMLFARVSAGNELFVQNFNELVETKTPKGESEDKPKEDVSEIVNRLVEEEKIKDDGGKWVGKSKVAVGEWNKTPFYDTKQSDPSDSRLALIEHLKTNETLLGKISS